MRAPLMHRIHRDLRRGVVLYALLLFACAPGASETQQVTLEVVPRILPLELDEDLAAVEFSSICWWDDELVLLPQHPELAGRCLLVLSRDSIARAVAEIESGREVRPLRPRRIPTETASVPDSIRAYDGLEAIVIRDDRCYVLAEYGNETEAWGSRLITGSIERDRNQVYLEHVGATEITSQGTRTNFTEETLILSGNECWVISELNGRRVVDRPSLLRFSLDLEPLGDMPMPPLEYRVTDATNLDAEGRFWVLNIFWPPDADLVLPEVESGPVERLVPLRRNGDRIERDPSRPILDLRGNREGPMHNWEGVARWGDDGFLLVTDEYPENLLAYVAQPE